MIDNGYLYASDEKRLFINTSLGCSSGCKFCYLSKLGILDIKSKSWEEVLELLNNSDYKYNEDTLITIGCFSECFDEINKKETIKILKYFLSRGNQVQLATKRCITYDEIKDILPLVKYRGQLVIFVSSSTITHYDEYELGTDSIDKRFKTFDLLQYDIPVVLYIKPVIENITIKDIDLYSKLIHDKKIEDVVVGSIFTENVSKETVHFSSDNKLFYNKCEDEDIIIGVLSSKARICRRSTEVLSYFRRLRMIEEVKHRVFELLNKDNSGHGMDHINRVFKLSIKFAQKEQADEMVVSLISLLHEVDDYKLFGEESAKNLTNAKLIMNEVGIDIETQNRVLDAIRKIGYKKYLGGVRPDSLEGMIVSDADMCDGLGVTGILRTYDYQKAHGRPFFDREVFPDNEVTTNNYKLCDDSAVCHCFDKLLRLKGIMMTESGKEEASSRHDIVVSILYHLFDEEDAPEWSDYLDKFLNELENENKKDKNILVKRN